MCDEGDVKLTRQNASMLLRDDPLFQYEVALWRDAVIVCLERNNRMDQAAVCGEEAVYRFHRFFRITSGSRRNIQSTRIAK